MQTHPHDPPATVRSPSPKGSRIAPSSPALGLHLGRTEAMIHNMVGLQTCLASGARRILHSESESELQLRDPIPSWPSLDHIGMAPTTVNATRSIVTRAALHGTILAPTLHRRRVSASLHLSTGQVSGLGPFRATLNHWGRNRADIDNLRSLSSLEVANQLPRRLTIHISDTKGSLHG